ncbi:MAG: cytochrome c oxidase subunit II [Chloroflexota bacterium]|nr:cytochrome c oxidase subunit II [Chloroflexota bacterium]
MNLTKRSPESSSAGISPIWIVAGGLAIILGGLIIGSFTPSLLPPQASAESRQVDDLFRFMLVIGGAIFLLVQGLLVYSVVRFRAKPGDTGDGAAMHGSTTLEFIWTIIPAIIVTVIAIYSVVVWNSTHSIKPNEQVVGAVGARYAWTFNYNVTSETLPPGLTVDQLPTDTQTALNDTGALLFSSGQLHTWVNQPVAVSMQTNDVNHAFWVPGMRVKQDLLAGRTTEVRFTPIEAGVYRIVCAELCGSGHGNMAGSVDVNGNLQGAWLIVHESEDVYLREFYEPNARQLLFPPEDPALRGRAILASGKYPCASCHVVNDLNWVGAVGPNLNNVGNRAETRVAGLSAAEYLHSSIRYPGEYLVPGYNNLMPQFNPEPDQTNYMPEDDLTAIIAYLLTLKVDA